MEYIDFLTRKLVRHQPTGFDVDTLNNGLFDWQKAICKWALKAGKAALFEDCGLGKTPQQLVWANEVVRKTNSPVLVLAPLAVSAQTKREGEKFGIDVNIARTQDDITDGINVVNYERLSGIDCAAFAGVVLDESSILKAFTGKTKRMIIDRFKQTPFKLACTATPAPNNLMEILNHAEFLGIMNSSEALSIWFLADQKQSGKYVLKGHARKDFWEWVSSWAVCIEKPSDIGFANDGYVLPPLKETDVIIPVNILNDDFSNGLLRDIDLSATGFYREKRRTLDGRVMKCAEIAASTDEQYLIWCDTNDEADALKRTIPDALEIRGADKPENKEKAALAFIEGRDRILISKPSIFGFGLNFQNCANSIFCGLNYSYESYYQAVRRFYRFGQTRPVNIWRVLGSTEKHILDVIRRKEQAKLEMFKGVADNMAKLQSRRLSCREFRLDLKHQAVDIPDWIRSESV